MPHRGLKEMAAGGVFWAAIRTWGVQFGSLLVYVVMARLLGPADFGLIAMAAVYMDAIDRLVDSGFADAIVQRKELSDGHLDSAFWTSVALALAGILTTFLAAPLLARVLGEPRLVHVMWGLSVIVLFTALRSVQTGLLRRRLAFRALALRGITSVWIGGAVGIAMAFAGLGVWSLVGQQIARECVGVLVLWATSDWRPGLRATRAHLRELWQIAAPIMGSRLLLVGQRRASDFIIGGALGSVALGFFAVGQRIVTALTRMMVDSIAQVAFPTFARLQGDPDRLLAGYYRAMRYSALLAFPAFLGAAALAPEIVLVGLGERWAASVMVMQVLCVLGITWTAWEFNSAVLQAVGAVRIQLRLGLLGALTNLLAIVIGLRWGIEGVAVAMLVRSALFAPISTLVVRRRLGISLRQLGRATRAPLVGASAAAGVALLASQLGAGFPAPLVLALGTAAGAAAYVTTVRLLDPGLLPEVVTLARETAGRMGRRKGSPADLDPIPPTAARE